ncbi:hypothetical protein [Klebsiella sp. 2680]|uniref:hypothetical protein n=1 Tax=Klebsiella sp. 2680 TaxID=2018037 RepID=UPI0011585735|nr:hypothetical protein [Klebsiella sp. 2680]
MNTYLVWCPENGEEREDAREFEAHDASDAAQVWAEHDDSWSADYQIVSGISQPVVCVALGDGPVERFRVSGECVAQYYASPVSEEVKGE